MKPWSGRWRVTKGLEKWLRQAKRAFWMPQNAFWLSEYLHRPYLVTQCAGIPKGLEHTHEREREGPRHGHPASSKMQVVNQNLISKNHPPIFQIARGQGKAKTAGSQRALKMVGGKPKQHLGCLKMRFCLCVTLHRPDRGAEPTPLFFGGAHLPKQKKQHELPWGGGFLIIGSHYRV